jgi:hypothetical protein
MAGFDLSSLASEDARMKRPILAVVACTCVGLLAELAWLFASSLHRLAQGGIHTPGNETFVLAELLSLLVIAVGLVSLPTYFPGAIKVVVDHEKLSLTYPNGAHEVYNWSTSGKGFELRDYSEYDEMSKIGRAYLFEGPHIWSRRSPLTKEAYYAIVAEVSAQRVPFEYAPSRPSDFGRVPRLTKVRCGRVSRRLSGS